MPYDPQNIFARIIRKEIPAEILHEDAHTLAFYDVAPQAKTHILIIPKEAYVSFDDFAQKAAPAVIGSFFKTVQDIAAQHGLPATGYRLVTNSGEGGGQTVLHFHVHLLARSPLTGQFGSA